MGHGHAPGDRFPTPARRSKSTSSIIKQTGVVYDRNGVVIKSFPAVHIYDGPVSYRLEWNGLTFVFSGDTTPSQFFVDNAQGADLLIHECFNTVTQLIERSGYDEKTARAVGTMVHTAPDEAGQVLALVKPRLRRRLPLLQRLRHRRGRSNAKSASITMVRSRWRRISWCSTSRRMTFASAWRSRRRTCGRTRSATKADFVRPRVTKQGPKMSRWLADKQLFPKF